MLNRGLLPEAVFRPAVRKGWRALSGCIQPDGRLGFVQQIGEKPGVAGPASTEVYGTGAFLLTKALYELERTGGRYGLVSMCCGGGLGTGTLIERL